MPQQGAHWHERNKDAECRVEDEAALRVPRAPNFRGPHTRRGTGRECGSRKEPKGHSADRLVWPTGVRKTLPVIASHLGPGGLEALVRTARRPIFLAVPRAAYYRVRRVRPAVSRTETDFQARAALERHAPARESRPRAATSNGTVYSWTITLTKG